jgi:hypothetical protein
MCPCPCPWQARNDGLADTLSLARRRLNKQEDARNAAELKLEYAEVGGMFAVLNDVQQCTNQACYLA